MTIKMLSLACAVCFGDPNSLASKGIIGGVLLLLGVVSVILFGIASLAFVWFRRSKTVYQKTV